MVKIIQGLIKAFFSQFLRAFLNLLVGKLSDTVIEIVSTVGKNTDWTDAQKREEAYSKIKEIAKNNSIQLKDSVVALITEIAVSIWKGTKI